jgi:hypothetical protein
LEETLQTSNGRKKPRIVVAGAGIAGSLVLSGLRQRNDCELIDLERVETREYGEAPAMPQLVARAQSALPGVNAILVSGEDDAPDVQTGFDLSAIGHDLGWRPGFPIERGLGAYRDALRAGAAAP